MRVYTILLRSDGWCRSRWIYVNDGRFVLHETSGDGITSYEREIPCSEALALKALALKAQFGVND